MNLFPQKRLSCPRCLGKGTVDWEDIKRLDRELMWIPGTCAYCEGRGKVSKKVINRVSADCIYMATNVPKQERRRLRQGDPGAIGRSKEFEKRINMYIRQIEFLHVEAGVPASLIADFLLIPEPGPGDEQYTKEQVLDYVERVIAKKKVS